MENKDLRIAEKPYLTLQEASSLFNIGINRLRSMTDEERCKYVLFVGSKRLIKRKMFEKYLDNETSI